jgi:hypothetical protein
MIQTGFETRVKIQDVIESQLPGFILQESPLTSDFLKQYYISQEYQGGPVDIAENLDQYLKLDNLTPEVIVDNTYLSAGITSTASTIVVNSTKGYPQTYGLLKIDDEIITYTGVTTNTFTGCIRGFSGITSYHSSSDPEELVFSSSNQASHDSARAVYNLSSLFLKEFYKKFKSTFTPGLENNDFASDLNIGNFIKSAKSFYQSKGTEESFRILFNVLYGVTPTVVNLSEYLIRPSSAEYLRREQIVVEPISGDPSKLVGQTITKSTDPNTYASVSQAEILTINGKIYYKLSLFVGYNDSSAIVGTFDIPGKSKVIEQVSPGDSIITVDSTIGFPQSGIIISGNNIINYSDKSVNQFYGCSGITTTINVADNIRFNETVFGYENGDITKLVSLRITGVLSDFIASSKTYNVNEGDEISAYYLGEIIENPSIDKTYKQIFANSWIYNTSSRYQVGVFSGSSYTLSSPIDKSSLKVGDRVDILERETQTIVSSNSNPPYVSNVDITNNQVNLNNIGVFTPNPNLNYDIRRRIVKTNSSLVPIGVGNDKITSNVQNLYLDGNDNAYVASSGLSTSITTDVIKATLSGISSYNSNTNLYSIILFANSVPFYTGDAVYYQPQSTPIPGLSEQIYYVEVLSSTNQIRLYNSRSFIGSNSNYVGFSSVPTNSGSHDFILNGKDNNYISNQKLLKKFTLIQNIQDGLKQETVPGTIGMLINGVEIENYKSDDKIYYGPLDSVSVLNGGSNYDVINPPVITASVGLGSTALIQPVVSGSIKKVFVAPQDFDLNVVVSIAITGGNGSGAILNPILQKRRREISFDARILNSNYGGVDTSNETITFLSNHNLNTGDSLIYNSNGNNPLGIGTFGGSNLDQNRYLVDNGIYYVSIVNSKTVQLYNSKADSLTGINTVGFTTANANGTHKFNSGDIKNTLTEIKVVNGGVGYTNRKLITKPSGISTINSTVNFTNHGFNEGDLIVYNYQTSPIAGLNTTNQYYISKIDNDYFKLCDAGIGGTNSSNYQRKNTVTFSGTGSGYQYFSYSPISIVATFASVGVGSTAIKTVGIVTATAIVRGEIIDTYLYEPGSDYGSTTLNFHKKPKITTSIGSGARLIANVSDGHISSVNVLYGGTNYYSPPDIVINGTGSGAVIQATVNNGIITSADVINSGLGYTSSNISVTVSSVGSNAVFDSAVRSLTVNNNFKYGDEIIKPSIYDLKYSVSGYSAGIRTEFNDNDQTKHSPIIGWAYDGNPIYGPFGYSDSQNTSSLIKILTSGYQLNSNLIINRPSGFSSGFFVEDYTFSNGGDLDQNNGRFSKTPDFPNGVYAYFAGVTTSPSNSTLISNFPYFVGNTYRSTYITDNLSLDQSFDFNNSDLIRNTFPYKLNDKYATNDFIIESTDSVAQKSIVESVSKGSIDSFSIVTAGTDYQVGDQLEFDNTGTNGGGIAAAVYSVDGVGISSIQTNIQTYNNTVLTWNDGNSISGKIVPYHNLLNGDNIIISGLSTSATNLNGIYSIGVTTYYTVTSKYIPSNPSSGIVTDIYVSEIPQNISIGSSVVIGNETLSILNIFEDQNVLRVNRGISGTGYTTSTLVQFISDTFTISKKSNYFDSKINDKVFFNPLETVGCGVSAGVSTSTTFAFAGITSYPRSIPSQSIYIENHPFKDNQQVVLSLPGITGYALQISTSFGSVPFNLPGSGISTTVYVTNKSRNTIGIKTTLNSSEVFFTGFGVNSNSYFYSLESIYNQVISKTKKIQATVYTNKTHNLSNDDVVDLVVNPNLSVGIGTSSSIYVKYDSTNKKLLINPIGFSSTGINTSNNTITIPSHNLVTGSKVTYSATDLLASGLSTSQYFVYKVDSDSIQLCQTYYDSQQNLPTVVSIASTGGKYQTISAINPQINVIRNNNLVFNLSDSSLAGYNFKIYYDQSFNDEFVSTGATTGFNISGVGTVGVSTNASLTLIYDSDIPNYLYYSLEKSGSTISSDSDVENSSQIAFSSSTYTGEYIISGIGTTSFNISLTNIPENLSYIQSQCDNLSYSTNSLTAYGPIAKIRTISKGLNYKKLPLFTGVASSIGSGAYIVPQSNAIGNITNISILNEGFEYTSDKTLKPNAYISPAITLKSSDTISNIEVTDGGKYYTNAPNLIVVDSLTGEEVNNGILKATLTSNSISSVAVVAEPKGLATSNEIIAINNTNGSTIDKVYSSSSGVVTCVLTTPILGFSTYSPAVFYVGDKIFVEGIQKYSNDGSGFNSSDYNYQFFTVTNASAITANPFQIEYNISGLTTNPGIAKTAQESIASAVNYKNYPKFTINQIDSPFIVGEKLLVNINGSFIEEDITVTYYGNKSIKVSGSYSLEVDNIIKGKSSGTIATVDTLQKNYGKFNVDYSTKKDHGWSNDIGKLNYDNQVIADNDYYQDLAYTVKSPIQFEDLITPVNNLLHTTGTKNFADVGITSNSSNTISGISTTTILYDIIDENRVDTLNIFDTVVDYSNTNNSSAFLKFNNKNLTSYIQCSTNRALRIDDISSRFSNSGLSVSDQNNIISISPTESYNRYLVQIVDLNKTQFQLTEVIVLNDSINGNLFELQRGSVYNQKIGDIEIYTDSSNNSYLYFNPLDPNNYDYNIKILKNNFSDTFSGIGSTSVGFVNLISKNNIVNSGVTTALISVSAASTSAVYSNIQLIDNVTNSMNYVEIYLTTDGTNTYLAENYTDSSTSSTPASYNHIGTFGASISSGVLSLNYTNTGINSVTAKSKNVSLGSTSAGIGTYRFILNGQTPGYERSAKYQADYSTVSTASSIVTVSRLDTSAIKSLVEVSIGATSALHQVMLIQDNTDIQTLQYPFISIGSTSGIGTFGGVYDSSGSNFSLVFYPSASITGNIKVLAYSECLYTDIDEVNIPPSLQYGSMVETVNVATYSGNNGARINRVDFDLKYNGTPIFQKTFNPTDSSVLNPSTGVFTIANHFFSTGEALNYEPGSSFIGIGSTGVGIGATLNSAGIVTTILPSVVYPIKLTNNTFRLSTRKDYSLAGIYVTFTSYGLGNAHTLEMNKRLERTIIAIDNVVQYPIAYTPINYTLYNNGGSVSASSTTFSLSGISSIKPSDLLYIDNEYMKVLNVGLGTTSSGPITNSGTVSLVNVSRGSVGSISTSHLDSRTARIYRGSYNISGGQIHFTDSPIGNLVSSYTSGNLAQAKSSFNGRVFLKQDYTNNQLYDEISDKFTGIGQTYTLTVQGINTVGLGSTGNGVLFINQIFQTPTTPNNSLNNFSIVQNNSLGITSAVFSGITSSNGSIIISNYDVNQNQLPRGGVIISLGSTGGVGYAPLVGAAATVTLNGSGAITSIGIGTSGSYGSGYYGNISIGITDPNKVGNNNATINAVVGAGGTLIFSIGAAGTGYVNPVLQIPSPSYSNLTVKGISRSGVSTTATGSSLLLNVNVAPNSTTGIGSTLFKINSFQIARPGYAFQKGDVFTPVGLVTAAGIPAPLSQYQLTVLDTFSDSFAAWQFGDLDYIDSIAYLQDGVRTRFPLYYNSQLLSYQLNTANSNSLNIDLNAILLIFINGVIQDPGVAYQFDGGSSFTLTEPPLPSDKVSIFFYRGTRGVDSDLVTIYQTIKVGDNVQVFSNNSNLAITTTQKSRVVFDTPSSDKIQTNIYSDVGIDINNSKPLSWTKQKIDTQINGQIVYKSRDSIESLIYPTAKIIKNFSSTDTQLFVDDANFFKYEQNLSGTTIQSFDGLIVSGAPNPVAAAITATVSAAGTVRLLTIGSAGSGYVGAAITVKIAKPPTVGVGLGTTATATVTVTNGTLTAPITITNPGFGYSSSKPPQVIVPLPSTSSEYISGVTLVEGFAGIITGITTTSGTSGNPLALKFYLNTSVSNPFPSGLTTGYPIFICDTSVGKGVTSIDSSNSAIVGIGTSHLDNIYYVHAFTYDPLNNLTASITCNINSNTSVVGIATTGSYVGRYSWGRLSGFSRSSSPISIAVTALKVDVGLTTFASIQRRNYGIRNSGGIKYSNLYS